MITENFDTL